MRVEVDRSGRLGQVADWNISICIIVMTGSVGLRLPQQVPGWPGASQQSCYRSAAPSAPQSPSLPCLSTSQSPVRPKPAMPPRFVLGPRSTLLDIHIVVRTFITRCNVRGSPDAVQCYYGYLTIKIK